MTCGAGQKVNMQQPKKWGSGGAAKSIAAVLLALSCIGAVVQAQPFAKGLILLPAKEYESLPALPRFRDFLPSSADLSAWLPGVGHQGTQSSCTAWATTYYMRSYYVNRDGGNAGRSQSLSPAFVYNQLAPPGTGCSEGLYIRRALDFLKSRGAPPMESFPYAMSSCAAVPSQSVEQQAGNFRIRDWKRLDRGKLDDVKGEVAAGNPVVIAMLLPPSFVAHKGSAAYDDITPSQDAHAMTVVGYDDNRRAFRLINSWGVGWGDRGYAWISYRAFQSDVPEAYAARVDTPPPKPQPVIVAPPKPEPPKPQPVIVQPPKPEPPKPQPVIVEPPKPEPPKPLPVVVEPPKPEPPKPQPVIVEPPKPEPPKPPPVIVEPPRPEPPKPAPVIVEPPKPEPPKPSPVVVQPPKPEPPKPQPVIVQPPKPVPTLRDIERQVNALAKDMRCADVRAILRGNQLSVSGFVGELADTLKLRDLVSAVSEGVKLDVQHRPWPQCETLLTLAKPLEESAGLGLSIVKPQLREGDALSFQVTSPAYAAYLYVSYLQADGQVVHLRRYADQGNKPLPAGTRLTLGSKGEYMISGPTFGQESLVVVASATPLLALDRPQEETEREYLTEFRLAILAQQQVKGKVSAAFLPITTSKR
jgi:hypothetical protein